MKPGFIGFPHGHSALDFGSLCIRSTPALEWCDVGSSVHAVSYIGRKQLCDRRSLPGPHWTMRPSCRQPHGGPLPVCRRSHDRCCRVGGIHPQCPTGSTPLVHRHFRTEPSIHSLERASMAHRSQSQNSGGGIITGARAQNVSRNAGNGVPMHRQDKLLGIDYASGNRIVRSVQRGRLAVIVQRKRRYTRLGPTAARVLINTGALPALRYGAGVIGANKAMLKAARKFACGVRGDMRGRSSYARLRLADYDPGSQLATDPIFEWAREQFGTTSPTQRIWKPLGARRFWT